jgi:hypothetical protein
MIDVTNNLIVPFPDNDYSGIIAFFGATAQGGYSRNEDGQICNPEGEVIDSDEEVEYASRTKAVTTVGSYKSALKDYIPN